MKRWAQGRRAGQRGFTLMELLTVIAIIAILAGLLFPVLGTVRNNARKGQCMSNLHSIIQAVQMYKDDWRTYPEALYGVSLDGMTIQPRLFPNYVRDDKVFNCPDSPVQLNARDIVTARNFTANVMTSYGLPLFSSYDFQFRPMTDTNGERELHYTLKWTAGVSGLADDRRQLIYRNPPDNTVVTWCHYHSGMRQDGSVPKGGMALVAFLNGRVQPIPYDQLPAWSPTSGPWQVQPKP